MVGNFIDDVIVMTPAGKTITNSSRCKSCLFVRLRPADERNGPTISIPKQSRNKGHFRIECKHYLNKSCVCQRISLNNYIIGLSFSAYGFEPVTSISTSSCWRMVALFWRFFLVEKGRLRIFTGVGAKTLHFFVLMKLSIIKNYVFHFETRPGVELTVL